MTRRDDPFEGIDRFFERMSDQFERASESFEDGRFGLDAIGGGIDVDLCDDEEEYVVTADLPGCDSDDIEVTLDGRTLRIHADFETEEETEDEGYLRRERRSRSTTRALTLPTEVDDEGIGASCQNGVLTIHLPKAAPADEGVSIDVE